MCPCLWCSCILRSLRHKLPTKPLRNELFLRTMQKNNIISDGDSAGRLYELLTDNKPGKP